MTETNMTGYIVRAATMCSGHPAAWHDASGKVLNPDQQMARVVQCDPLGFLLAVMGGRPILAYRLEPVGKRYRARLPGSPKGTQIRRVMRAEIAVEEGVRIMAEYWTPSLTDRIRVARALAPLQVSQLAQNKPVDDPDPERTRQIRSALEQEVEE